MILLLAIISHGCESTSHFRTVKAPLSLVHEIVLMVKLDNMNIIKDIFSRVSDPNHEEYGHFLSFSEVNELTANVTRKNKVLNWLVDMGANISWTSPNGGFVKASANISMWSLAFSADFYHYLPADSNITRLSVVRAEKIEIPMDISEEVASLFGLTDFPIHFHMQAPSMQAFHPSDRTSEEALGCTNKIDINILKTVYNITGTAETVSQSVFSTIGQSFSPSDLSTFQQLNGIPANPIAAAVGQDASDAICATSTSSCIEANLDVQYMTSIATLSPTTYWYQSTASSNSNEFVDWIMSVSSDPSPPLVHSISYAIVESAVSASLMQAFDNAAIALGVRGISIVAASGDSGVSGVLLHR